MINIEHVSKQFGSLQVLEDISINIDQGDIFGSSDRAAPVNPHCCAASTDWKSTTAALLQ